MDITPTEEVLLVGSPSPKKTSTVGSRLYAKALVLSAGGQKVAIVTLDTLKYPMSLAEQAQKRIELETGIPAGNVMICSSHTHSGPLWSTYKDKLVSPICEAVALAAKHLEPCQLRASAGKVEGLSQCRRVIKEGATWNRWLLPPEEAERYPAEGPADHTFALLAVVGPDGRNKAILYNYACHGTSNHVPAISADFPGAVQQSVSEKLGYDAPTYFLTGACGDVNPIRGTATETFGETLGTEIIHSLGRSQPIADAHLWVERRQEEFPGREHPEFNEAEVARKWPGQLEHYRMAFTSMKQREQPTYPCSFTGLRLGDDFALVTNPTELFSTVGIDIKRQSPFKYTMVVEQTNGAHGYIPTTAAFAGGGYETWYGEHSYLTTHAADMIDHVSVEILQHLRGER